MSETRLQLGSIVAAHGIKGWVKVFSFTDPMPQILSYSPWYLQKGKSTKTVDVVEGRQQGKGLIACLADIEDRNEAELLIGYDVWVDYDALPDLDDGEYYWHQLIGLTVTNTDGEQLGQIDHMLETGANDVMVVKPTTGSVDDQTRLVPYVEDRVVLAVDLEDRAVTVDWSVDY